MRYVLLLLSIHTQDGGVLQQQPGDEESELEGAAELLGRGEHGVGQERAAGQIEAEDELNKIAALRAGS